VVLFLYSLSYGGNHVDSPGRRYKRRGAGHTA